jgi:hypothetical protein
LAFSVADPDPGSGAFLTLDLGSGIGFVSGSPIPDLGFGSQTHIFDSLMTIILSVLLKNIFFTCSEIKLFTIL